MIKVNKTKELETRTRVGEKVALEGWINTLLKFDTNNEKVKKVFDRNPLYNVGEKVDLVVYGERKENIEIQDIKVTYHPKLQIYCYGYKLKTINEEETGLTFTYIPEGYLRKHRK